MVTVVDKRLTSIYKLKIGRVFGKSRLGFIHYVP
jgi:hypothetical protein